MPGHWPAQVLLATVFPALPVWLMAFVFIVMLTAVNLTRVKNFGEFEFWFALLKVAAIIAPCGGLRAALRPGTGRAVAGPV